MFLLTMKDKINVTNIVKTINNSPLDFEFKKFA